MRITGFFKSPKFKRIASEFSERLNQENELKGLIYLSISSLKEIFNLKWVVFYDNNKQQTIFGPGYESGSLGNSFSIKPEFSEYHSPKFFTTNIWVVLPIKVRDFSGYFILGKRLFGRVLDKEEKFVLSLIYEHIKTAFAKAVLYEGLSKQVHAQVKNLTYKNRRLNEVINNRLEFVQTASHELRTPITVLSGALQLLLQNEISDNEKKELLRLAYNRAQNLASLVTGILRLAKYQKDDSELNLKEKVNLLSLFQDVLSVARSEIENRGLQIKINEGENLYVLGNRIYLEQAFYNLIENAIQNTESGKIEVFFMVDEKHIVTAIRDSGKGIEESLRANIFKKHAKGKTSGGLGLGLYLTRVIIDTHHKGHVWFESSPQGTTFYVRLRRSMV